MKSKHRSSSDILAEIKFYQYISSIKSNKEFDVVIIGGSYAGLSAAIILGRSVRNVLLIDNGKPCNRRSPVVHNFITRDAATTSTIAKIAKAEALRCSTVKFIYDKVLGVKKTASKFIVETKLNENYTANKILLATGILDQVLTISGFAECWGISVLPCPYHHGYEYHNRKIGIIANGNSAYEMAKLMSNWTNKLTLLTNGTSTLTTEQTRKLEAHHFLIIQKRIAEFKHEEGKINTVVFKDNSIHTLNAIFTRVPFLLSTDIPLQQLGCELTGEGLIKTDMFQKTSVHGIYAAGDNTSNNRAISVSLAAGTIAGMSLNMELTEEKF